MSQINKCVFQLQCFEKMYILSQLTVFVPVADVASFIPLPVENLQNRPLKSHRVVLQLNSNRNWNLPHSKIRLSFLCLHFSESPNSL